MNDMPLLIQTLAKRDPLFAKLTPEQKTIVTQKLISQPGTLYKILYTRDPAFKELNGRQRKQVIDKFVSDYKNLTQQSIQKSKQAATFEQATAPDLTSASSLFLGNTFIDPVAAITAGAVGALGAAKAGLSAGRALLSGAVASGADVPVGVGSEAILDKVFKSDIPTPIKIGLGLVVPLALGATSAKMFEGRLQKAIINKADKEAFLKIKNAIFDKAKSKKITLEDLQNVVDSEIKNPEAGKVIDLVLKDPNVSDEFKKTVYALPDYAFEMVKPEFRRDLPVPSKAQPMQENIPEINKIANEAFIKPTQKVALPESPITKGEVIPEGTIIPTGEAQKEITPSVFAGPVEGPVESPMEPIKPEVKVTQQPKQYPEEVKLAAQELLDRGGAKDLNDALQKVIKRDYNKMFPVKEKMRPINYKNDKDLATVTLIESIISNEKGINSKKVDFWQAKNNPEIMRVYFGKSKDDYVPISKEIWDKVRAEVENTNQNDFFDILDSLEGKLKNIKLSDLEQKNFGFKKTQENIEQLKTKYLNVEKTKERDKIYNQMKDYYQKIVDKEFPELPEETKAMLAGTAASDTVSLGEKFAHENIIAEGKRILRERQEKAQKLAKKAKALQSIKTIELKEADSILPKKTTITKILKPKSVFIKTSDGFIGEPKLLLKEETAPKNFLKRFESLTKKGRIERTSKELGKSIGEPLSNLNSIIGEDDGVVWFAIKDPQTAEIINSNIVGIDKNTIGFLKKNYKQLNFKITDAPNIVIYDGNKFVGAISPVIHPAPEDILKRFGVDVKPLEFYTGLDLIKGLQQADELVKNGLQKIFQKLQDKKAFIKTYQLLKSLSHPLPHLPKESVERFENALYGEYRPGQAKGALKADQLGKLVRRLLKNYSKQEQTAIEVIVRYMEDPTFRDVARKLKDFKGITKDLDKIVNAIDTSSNELMKRGFITPSQRAKWAKRYLARLYMQDKLSGISSVGGVTQQKIFKNRKIESIMDIAKKDREALGYIEDPELAIRTTIAKNWHNTATDDFYKEIVKDPTIVPQEFLVKNPFNIEGLPKEMSPKFAKEKLLPWLEDYFGKKAITDEKIKSKLSELKEDIKNKETLIESIKDKLPDDYFVLSGDDVKYGILTGAPIHKDVGLQIKSIWNITNEPETALGKMDKALSTIYTWFKIAKVPFNLRSYPRNFISNIFQFALEGYNPVRYIKEMPETVKGILTKDKYYKEALRMGLIGENFAKREIIDVLQQLKGENGKLSNVFDFFQKAAVPYGWIDDFAKLNTYRIFRERGLSRLEAIKKAQQIHYDYGYVPYWVRQVRSPRLDSTKGIAGKLLLSPFITFMSKSAGQLFRALANKPVTTAMLVSSLYVLKNKIEQYYKKKYGKKYEVGQKLRPEWLRDPLVVHIMTKDGKHLYVDITQILPVGWLSKAIYEAGQGKVGSALSELGFGSSPLGVPYEAITGKDIFTGKELYSPLDTEIDKLKKGAAYVAEQWLEPATIEQIKRWRESKQPVFERWLTGTNIYKYGTPELAAQAIYRQKKLEGAYLKELYRLKYKYQQGKINKEDLRKRANKIAEKYKKKLKEIMAP